MKAISLWQPWASAIALGLKRVETRGWKLTGSDNCPFAIHAAKKNDRTIERWYIDKALIAGAIQMPAYADLPRGAIVAVAVLEKVLRTEEALAVITPREEEWGDYSPNRFAWFFANVRPLARPFIYAGSQGVFEVPDSLFAGRGFLKTVA